MRLVFIIIIITDNMPLLGLTLLRALYFEYPEAEESYVFKNQVNFGQMNKFIIVITLVFLWSSHYGSSYH